MRLRHLCAAALVAAGLPASAIAVPMAWPAEDAAEADVAFHCAAVMTAFGQAYVFATELLNMQAPPPATVPQRLVALAGGQEQMSAIIDTALGWRDSWESVARTSFYPRLTQEGTPYLADEGAVLMASVNRCVERFDL